MKKVLKLMGKPILPQEGRYDQNPKSRGFPKCCFASKIEMKGPLQPIWRECVNKTN